MLLQDWQNKCIKLYINPDVVDEWARIAKDMAELSKGKANEDGATEMMALLEGELKTVHDVMGKKWRCVVTFRSVLFALVPAFRLLDACSVLPVQGSASCSMLHACCDADTDKSEHIPLHCR